jgi:predicted transcriptional regulator
MFTYDRIATEGGHDVNVWIAKKAEEYATPEERAACSDDPDYYYDKNEISEYVICLEDRCGFKSKGSLKKHLESQHRKTVRKFKQEHKSAPTIARAWAKEKRKALEERSVEQKRKLQQVEKLKGWDPAKRAVAETIIENPHLDAREIGMIMDSSRTASRPPESWNMDSWERAFTESRAGISWYYRTREDIKPFLQIQEI